ncbi:putative manganese transporter [Pseudoalteromonas sp. C2R02]|uniref:putative manganese transporter n=1 Tax=Pseudoalteromonas sp. C2R02 TaxID=2841565 RepID=UPI001C0A2780|nr:putative manganese transporter [Pseudoalteromonas sp. C2R02]MBU2968465.1 putative manganese transporter [Pseudoalteromonas sp. C2R02]
MFFNSTLYSNTYNISKILFNKRALLPLVLFAFLLTPATQEIVLQSLSDAFLQVSIFVAGTLFLYYYLVDKFPQLELTYVRRHAPNLEVPISAVLGALPGCGGAIIVVTQYTKRQASFGSVVAVLTATMGDAAFLLLATRPFDGMIVLSTGLIVGSISGYIVNKIHNVDYLAPEADSIPKNQPTIQDTPIKYAGRVFWRIVFIPSLIIALMLAFQFDFSAISYQLNEANIFFGAVCALIVVSLWAFTSKGETYQELTAEDDLQNKPSRLNRVMQDTHFVTAWVVAAFVLYELTMLFLGLDLKAWFMNYAVLAPLIGLLIGLLPGCGPQIVVTTLYIQGVIPFSALIANAISNDGDALFPAIALAPKAAFIATIYSTVPAFIVGYSVYYFFE